jgi:hypothetical protein
MNHHDDHDITIKAKRSKAFIFVVSNHVQALLFVNCTNDKIAGQLFCLYNLRIKR